MRGAIRLQYYASLLVFQVDADEPRPHSKGLAQYRQIAEALRDQIRNTNVLSVKPRVPSVHVLLPSAYLENLPGIIERIATAVNGRTFDTKGAMAPVSLSIGGTCLR
jgi:hypothetical protein